jgi:predicted O-methyltransferase YrrM
MTCLARLVRAYEAEGFQIVTGLNGTLYNDLFTAPFTRLIRNGRSISDGYGIALQELWFLEALAALSPARSVLVIGNSFGWSTLALALAHPDARVVAIDAGVDEYSVEGIALTNRLAARLGVRAEAVAGRSPEDVAPVLDRLGLAPFDLVFVDGLHTHEQMHADWDAVRPHLADPCIVLCHDVLMLQLAATFDELAATPGWQSSVLHATTSGMGVLHRGQPESVHELFHAVSVPAIARAAVDADAAEQGSGTGSRFWQAVVEDHHQNAGRAVGPHAG